MPFTKGMASSRSKEWETPWEFYRKIERRFHPTLDVCATAENTKCKWYFDEEANGLIQKWVGVCWCNPPYGHVIKYWLEKAYASSLEGATVVCLVPARVDTQWFQEFCMKGTIYFVRGRLTFLSPYEVLSNAPFPCAVVLFGAGYNNTHIVRSLSRT